MNEPPPGFVEAVREHLAEHPEPQPDCLTCAYLGRDQRLPSPNWHDKCGADHVVGTPCPSGRSWSWAAEAAYLVGEVIHRMSWALYSLGDWLGRKEKR